MPKIHQIIIIATIAAFVILFLTKTGLREKLRNYCDKVGIRVLADMLDCDFCLSFWICSVLAIMLTILTCDIHWLLAICCSTPITRILL